jgi:hypothetical protein
MWLKRLLARMRHPRSGKPRGPVPPMVEVLRDPERRSRLSEQEITAALFDMKVWVHMTAEDLAALGVRPGMGDPSPPIAVGVYRRR